MEQLRLRNIDFGMVSNGQAGFNGRIVDTGCVNDSSRVKALLCNPILSAIIVHIDLHRSAFEGLCAPRLDWLLLANDSLCKTPSAEQTAGLKAVLNAVPAKGFIFGDALPAESLDQVKKYKHKQATAKNNFERAFDIEFD